MEQKVAPKIYKARELLYDSGTKGIKVESDTYMTDPINKAFIEKELKLKDLESRKKRITEEDLVYIAKNSNLPRYKLKDYFMNNRLRKTKLPSLATTVIINREETYKFLTNLNIFGEYQIIYNQYIKQFLEKHGLEESDTYMIRHGYSYKKEIMEKLLLSESHLSPPKKFLIIKEYGKLLAKDLFTNLFEIAYNPNCVLVYDEDILEQINEDGVIVDKEVRESLQLMLHSKDPGDWRLALEVMANSDYKKSYLNISIVITNNWGLLNKRQFKKEWTQNFRSLMLYLESQDINYQNGWRDLCKTLISKFKGNLEVLEQVKEYIEFNVKKEFPEFDITNITVGFLNESVPTTA